MQTFVLATSKTIRHQQIRTVSKHFDSWMKDRHVDWLELRTGAF